MNNTKIKIITYFLCVCILITLCGCSNSNKSETRQVFAMDTYMTIEVWGDNAKQAADNAVLEINRLNDLWDIASVDSEISKLNSLGKSKVSDDTLTLLKRVISLNKETYGSIDITVYPLMEIWGFTSQNTKLPSQAEIDEALSHIGIDNIAIDESEKIVSLSNNARLDFGAIAKGYCADLIVNNLREANIKSALLNLGGNIYAMGYKPNKDEWLIGIENPDSEIFKDTTSIGAVSLHDMSLVTSGNYKRYFIENGQKYHHIMDPHTGYPANNTLISVSIITKDCTLADSLSTALFVMGKEKALTYWSEHRDSFDAILVERDGTITITKGIESNFKSDFEYQIVP